MVYAYPDKKYRHWVIDSWKNSLKHAMEKNSDIAPIEYNVICKSGEMRIFEISGIILKEGILATFIDLTDRKRAEEFLKQSEVRFRELFDEAPVGYHEIDKNGMIIKINNTELEMLQFKESEMVNHFIWELFVEDEICRNSVLKKFSGINRR